MASIVKFFASLAPEELPLFLRALSSNVDRKTYVDWLAERGDPRAETIRQEDAWRAGGVGSRPRSLVEAIAAVDPQWWDLMARYTRLNCGRAPAQAPRVRFSFECPESWTRLTGTETAGVRACGGCGERVYWCDDIESATDRARRGQCIAVSGALVHHGAGPGADMMVGRPDYKAMWADRIFRGRG